MLTTSQISDTLANSGTATAPHDVSKDSQKNNFNPLADAINQAENRQQKAKQHKATTFDLLMSRQRAQNSAQPTTNSTSSSTKQSWRPGYRR